MELTLTALVLKRFDQGESDRHLILLTRERGRVDAIAKGARKSGSRLSAAAEPMSHVQLQLAAGRKRAYVSQVQPISSFRGLRTDFGRMSHGLALMEILAAMATHELVNEELFDFAIQALHAIEHCPDPTAALVWAEVGLLDYEGVRPQLEQCVVTEHPLDESPAWVSPTAGGYVWSGALQDVSDRFQADSRALIGLSRIAELPEPPEKLKMGEECLYVLGRFWSHLLHQSLPARQFLMQFLAGESLKG